MPLNKKGKIKNVEKKKNGGLGKKSGPPPKKGPSSQGMKVLKLRGGGMDMGNAANQAQSAAMGNPSSTPSGGNGGTTHSPHSDTGYVKSSTLTKQQIQKSRDFKQQQKDDAGKRALDTAKVQKAPPFIPGAIVFNALTPVRQKSFEKNREYFRKNVVGKGYKNTLGDYKRYISGRGTGKVDAMGRAISSTGGEGRADSTPSIKVDPVTPIKKTPIPLMKVQPKTFDFEYKDGGLVRGSGKVLKGKIKKARIY